MIENVQGSCCHWFCAAVAAEQNTKSTDPTNSFHSLRLSQAMQQMPCQLADSAGHAGCHIPAPLETDVYVASGPCQPYSFARRGPSAAAVKAEYHPGFKATFGQEGIVGTVQTLQPHVFVSEQVEGFASPKQGTGSETYKDDFMHAIMDTTRLDTDDRHFAAAACLSLDSAVFMEGSRYRYSLGCSTA